MVVRSKQWTVNDRPPLTPSSIYKQSDRSMDDTFMVTKSFVDGLTSQKQAVVLSGARGEVGVGGRVGGGGGEQTVHIQKNKTNKNK